RSSQIGAHRGEQAGVQLAFGAEARAAAAAEEGSGDAGDDADLPGAVAVAEAPRDLALVVRLDRLERHLARDALDDLVARHHSAPVPAVGHPDVHVLDEAQDVPGSAEVPRQIHDRVLVDAALDDRVDLDRVKPGASGRFDADRKSTRLNSSHVKISYAVYCL